MPLNHTTKTRNILASNVTRQLDGGNLVIMTFGDNEIATLPLSNPAFNLPINGRATARAITADVNAVGGVASFFKMETADGEEVFRGMVGLSDSDLNLSSIDIAAGDSVQISSFSYSASL